MSGAHPEPTEARIIRKKKIHGGGSHGGAWKVAYADFVTAMMALFIVLWIMSQSQAVRQNVAQYFKNPGLLAGATGLMETSDMGGDIPTPGHSQDLQTPSPIQPDLSSERGSLEEVKKRITEVIAQLPELSRLKDQVALEITEDGLRIELLDRENSNFFDLGSTNLKRETQELLRLIAQELGKLPNRITVEGHTDSRPYGSKSYTNWELSADRANAARRLLEEAGVKSGQVIAVRGCADRQLRNQQDPTDFQNRRVSILVMFQGQSRQELLDIKKIQEDLHKSPKNSGASGPPGAPAPTVSGTGEDSPPPLPSPGKTGVVPPRPQSARPGEVFPRAPGKTENLSAPTSVYQGQVTPPTPRLEDQVQEEVRQLLQNEGLSDPSPGKAANSGKEPRPRLGW
jgi:chemotaxis protein MotB